MISALDIRPRFTAVSRGCLQLGKEDTKVPGLAPLTGFAGALLEGDMLAGQQKHVLPGTFLPQLPGIPNPVSLGGTGREEAIIP